MPYLTHEAAFTTLRFIGSLPGGAEVVFDYSNPPDSFSPELRAVHDARAARVAEIGEPWVSYFESDGLEVSLKAFGFTEVEDLGPQQFVARYFPRRARLSPGEWSAYTPCGNLLRRRFQAPASCMYDM